MNSIRMVAREIIAKTTEWIEEYDGAVRIIYSGHKDDEPEYYVRQQFSSSTDPKTHSGPSGLA